MKKAVPIADININGGTQQRNIDNDTVSRYAELMKENSDFEPVRIICDGKENWLVDGFHRYFAAQKLNRNYIEAEIENGTQRTAVFKSFCVNSKHGLPRQPGTLKEIVLKILKDPEWSKMSQVDIAKHVGCTKQFVNKIINEKVNQLTEKDNKKTEPEKSKNENKADTSESTAESTESQEVEKEVVYDETGRQVPENLVSVFKRVNEIKVIIAMLQELVKKAKTARDANDPLYSLCKIELLKQEVGNLKRFYKFMLPYAVCPYCSADVSNKECRACNGGGFVNKITYDASPSDLKIKP